MTWIAKIGLRNYYYVFRALGVDNVSGGFSKIGQELKLQSQSMEAALILINFTLRLY